MKKIDKSELRDLILDGITSEELNSKYDYSNVTIMRYIYIFDRCFELKELNILNFHLYDFNRLDNQHLKEKYPEHFI